jgi:cobalt-zinc-cadmium efflux system membrane fusion protein
VRVAAWPGRIFEGKVGWVAATLDPALRTGRVRVSVANRDHALRPEMLAQMSIDVPPRRALAVDRRAVVSLEGATFAYVAEAPWKDGRQLFRRRRVRVGGDPAAKLAVVEEGLASGDRVAIERPKAGGTEDGLLRISAKQLERAGIRVSMVTEQQVEDSLAAGARIAFDDVRVGHVLSPVTGRVTKVLAAPGDRVAKGAPLVTIVSPDVGAAYSDAVKAEADQVASGHEATRQRELFAAHAGSRKDLEAAEAALRKADAELERARQKTRLLSAGEFDRVTQEYTLQSPIAGVVVARGASPGLEVQGQWNGAGTPVELFTIGALDPLWIVGDVYEMDLAHVRPGQAAEVHVPAFPGRAFHGRVEWVSDVIDPATHTAKVRCTVPNPGGALRPEMAPVLQIALPAHRHLAVPRDALVRLGDDTVVFVLAEKTASGDLLFRRRQVVVGDERPSGLVPILEGLAPSEQVVVSGAIFLVGLL